MQVPALVMGGGCMIQHPAPAPLTQSSILEGAHLRAGLNLLAFRNDARPDREQCGKGDVEGALLFVDGVILHHFS